MLRASSALRVTLSFPVAPPSTLRLPAHAPRAAFLTMAAEIKNRMALVPQADDGAKNTVSVGPGQALPGKSGGGGCC